MTSDDIDMHGVNATGGETLGDLLNEIWQGRIFVCAGLVFGALAAFVMIALAVPHSKASVILAPASPLNMVAVSQSSSKGAPDAQGSVSSSSFTRFEASYKGAAVAGLLLRDPEITKGLNADRAFIFSDAQEEWSPEKLAEYIAKRIEVDPVGETPLRTLSYQHSDKAFAVMFLRRLHNVTDGLIRHSVRKDVNERIAYLNKAMAEMYNPDHRRAMTELLMEQERLKMLVSIDQPYAASIVVPAAASVKTSWPDAAFVYCGFMAAGALIGFVIFSFKVRRIENFWASLERTEVKQQPWFWPESGNNNEKPEEQKPLTGKKKKSPANAARKKKRSRPPEAAE